LPGSAHREADFKTSVAPKDFPTPSAQRAYFSLDNRQSQDRFEYETLDSDQRGDVRKRVAEVGKEDEHGPPAHLYDNCEDDEYYY